MTTRELAERFLTTMEARAWDDWVTTMHPDVVYETPQTRERIRDLARERLRMPAPDAFLAEVLAAESDY